MLNFYINNICTRIEKSRDIQNRAPFIFWFTLYFVHVPYVVNKLNLAAKNQQNLRNNLHYWKKPSYYFQQFCTSGVLQYFVGAITFLTV